MANTQTFTIAESAEAFDILSSKLYSNPVLAVIRELSTNAYDAQVVADTNDEHPVEVHLPTNEKNFFRVRDWGEGLDEDQVFTIYTQFFSSTKKDDEKQVGAFGLGSKSPFSVAEKYIVNSYQNGKKMSYLMSAENTVPTVSKISEEETSEHDGLEIIIDFDKCVSRYSDPYSWIKNAEILFRGTAFLPNINLPLSNWEQLLFERESYTTEQFEWRNSDTSWRDTSVLSVNVAGVTFKVEDRDHLIWQENASEMLKEAGIKHINITAQKFDVRLTPSREELHFNEKTITFIRQAVQRIILGEINRINSESRKDLENILTLLNDKRQLSYLEALTGEDVTPILEKKAGKYLEAWNKSNTRFHAVMITRLRIGTHFPFDVCFLRPLSLLQEMNDKNCKGVYKVDMNGAAKVQIKALENLYTGSFKNNAINCLASHFDDDVLQGSFHAGDKVIYIFDDLASDLNMIKMQSVSMKNYENYYKRWNKNAPVGIKTTKKIISADPFISSQTVFYYNGYTKSIEILKEKKAELEEKGVKLYKIVNNTIGDRDTDDRKLRALSEFLGEGTVIAYRRGAQKWYENQQKAGIDSLSEALSTAASKHPECLKKAAEYQKIINWREQSVFATLISYIDGFNGLDKDLMNKIASFKILTSEKAKAAMKYNRGRNSYYIENCILPKEDVALTDEEMKIIEEENKVFEVLKVVDISDAYYHSEKKPLVEQIVMDYAKKYLESVAA